MAVSVSVLIPTYNRKAYLREAIDSVLAQTYTDYEIIVVDDGSTDGTGEALAAAYGEQIRYVRQDNQGESVARNRGLELAQGEYVALLDSDDLWLPEKLARQMTAIETDAKVGLVFCQSWIIDGEGRRVHDIPHGTHLRNGKLTLEGLCLHNRISGPSTTLIRRAVLNHIGGFDPDIHFGEDWDLWLRIAMHYELAFVPEPLACIRRHHGTQCYYPSVERNAQRLAQHLTILEKAFASWPDEPPTELRRLAIGYQYAQAFLAEEAVGNTDAATQNMLMASRLTPALMHEEETFGQLIVNHAAIIAERADEVSLSEAMDYAQRVLQRLCTAVTGNGAFERKVMAAVHATLGFIAYRQKQRPAVTRTHFLRAIRLDQRWLLNGGLLSILAETLVGKHLSTLARQTLRRLRHSR